MWIDWAQAWDHTDGPWHRHPHHEECFVVAGEVTLRERQDQDACRAGPGSYFFRPAGTLHGGPGSRCEEAAITFHRCFGALRTEWVPSPEHGSPPEGSPREEGSPPEGSPPETG